MPVMRITDLLHPHRRRMKTYNNQFISIHNATCQLEHATFRTAFKGGGTIYSPPDLILITMHTGTRHHTADEDIDAFNIPFPHAQYDQPSPPPHNAEWLAPPAPPPTLCKNRRVYVSIGTKTLHAQGEAARYYEEGVAVPRYIPA